MQCKAAADEAIAASGSTWRISSTMFTTVGSVSFQWKNPDFLMKNPDFLLKNDDFITKTGHIA